ncbi:MAG: SURF1 family protein [Brevundimonas sp.]|uniref:SURF1 family protein n=1 Tax=Brevundimonas sp. TaxID=1871086 RepID=UPI00391D790D
MTTSELKGFPWLLTVLAAVVLAVLLGLGVWQVQRMAWKEGLIDQARAAAVVAPVPAAEALNQPGGEFRRVILECPNLNAAPFVELQSIHDGDAGVRLISACRPAGVETTFLVDRGFVREEISARPAVTSGLDPVRIIAVVREAPQPNWMSPPPQDGRFFARDHEAMGRALDVEGPVDSRVLFAETSANPEWAALTPVVPPAAFTNNHLGYALTWFGLAAALIVFYALMLKRRRRPHPGNDPQTGRDFS